MPGSIVVLVARTRNNDTISLLPSALLSVGEKKTLEAISRTLVACTPGDGHLAAQSGRCLRGSLHGKLTAGEDCV